MKKRKRKVVIKPHGGRRNGSGRKALGHVEFHIYLPPAEAKAFKKCTKLWGKSYGSTVVELLRWYCQRSAITGYDG